MGLLYNMPVNEIWFAPKTVYNASRENFLLANLRDFLLAISLFNLDFDTIWTTLSDSLLW